MTPPGRLDQDGPDLPLPSSALHHAWVVQSQGRAAFARANERRQAGMNGSNVPAGQTMRHWLDQETVAVVVNEGEAIIPTGCNHDVAGFEIPVSDSRVVQLAQACGKLGQQFASLRLGEPTDGAMQGLKLRQVAHEQPRTLAWARPSGKRLRHQEAAPLESASREETAHGLGFCAGVARIPAAARKVMLQHHGPERGQSCHALGAHDERPITLFERLLAGHRGSSFDGQRIQALSDADQRMESRAQRRDLARLFSIGPALTAKPSSIHDPLRLPVQRRCRRQHDRFVILARPHETWHGVRLATPQRLPISLVVIAQNEEANLGDCLSSAEFCEERLVLDGGSRDSTVALAREAGARVEFRAFDGWISQKNAALQLARNDWVLSLDADERVSPALRAEILALFADGPPPCSGYDMPRLSHHLGRWVRGGGWYPDRKLRLFRRSAGIWAGRDPHDKLALNGVAGRLRGDLLHYPYRDLRHHLQKMDRYTTVAAERLHAEGRGFALIQLLLRPPAAFVRDYLFLAGFRDGRVGLILAALSCRYQWQRFLKLHRLRRAVRSSHS